MTAGYLARASAAKYLDMTPKGFDQWVRRHGVPCKYIGRTRRFSIQKLEQVVNALTLRRSA